MIIRPANQRDDLADSDYRDIYDELRSGWR